MLVAWCAEAIIFPAAHLVWQVESNKCVTGFYHFPTAQQHLISNADLTTISPQVKTMQVIKWLIVKQSREWMSDLLVRRSEAETTRSNSSLNDSIYVVLDVHIPVDMINISIPDSDYATCGLYFFFFTAQTVALFKLETNKTTCCGSLPAYCY